MEARCDRLRSHDLAGMIRASFPTAARLATQAGRFARKRLTLRSALFAASWLVLGRIPVLAPALNLHPRRVTPEEVSREAPLELVGRASFGPSPETQGRGLRLERRLRIHRLREARLLAGRAPVIHAPSGRIVRSADFPLSRHDLVPALRLRHSRIEGTVAPLAGVMTGRGHYFHFFFDGILPWLAAAETLSRESGLTFVAGPDSGAPWQQPALDHLLRRFPGAEFRRLAHGERLDCARLLLTETRMSGLVNFFAFGPQIEELRALHLSAYGVLGPPRGRRLLISRAGQTTRRVLNEADLAARLAPLGFETVRPETLSHAEQVRLFHDAELVIAVTGAALTNLLFCSPSCTVIELRARDSGQSLYAGLSLQLGLRHRMVGCDSHGSARDLTVDPEAVVSVAQDLLGEAPGLRG